MLRNECLYLYILEDILVELVGFEPTSKQGNNMLSTRLSQPLVFQTVTRPEPPITILVSKSSLVLRDQHKLSPI